MYIEVKPREILISIIIICVMIILGGFISNIISDSHKDKMDVYNKSIKIDTFEKFSYANDTSVGNCLAKGLITANNPVSYDEVNGEYLSMSKITERYTMHTRVVTYTDSNGGVHTRTETYWTWDNIGRDSKISDNISFLGENIQLTEAFLPYEKHIDTIYQNKNLRDKYYGSPITSSAIIFSSLKDNNIDIKEVSYTDLSIREFIDSKDNNLWSWIFWSIWVLVTCGLVYAFVFAENRWLD